jgi:hypothetical protein
LGGSIILLAAAIYLVFVFPNTIAVWENQGTQLSAAENFMVRLTSLSRDFALPILGLLMLLIVALPVWLADALLPRWKAVIVAGEEVAALVLSWKWGLAFRFWPIQMLGGGYESEVAIIRRVMPHHLVNPESVHPTHGADLTLSWMMQETAARMAIIWALWAIAVAAVIVIRRRSANKPSDAPSQ